MKVRYLILVALLLNAALITYCATQFSEEEYKDDATEEEETSEGLYYHSLEVLKSNLSSGPKRSDLGSK